MLSLSIRRSILVFPELNKFKLKIYTMTQITITEDQALMLNISMQSLAHRYINMGYKITNTYTHSAVGLVYVLELDYSLAG